MLGKGRGRKVRAKQKFGKVEGGGSLREGATLPSGRKEGGGRSDAPALDAVVRDCLRKLNSSEVRYVRYALILS